MPSSSSNLLRLSKLMTQKGLCSRREADKLIEQGLIKVDGEIISKLGSKVSPDVSVEILKQGQRQLSDKVTFIFNKPLGCVSSQPEDNYKAAVEWICLKYKDESYVTQKRFHKGMLRGLAPAGRLDINSRGLLVLTQDGRIAKKLIGPKSKIEKEYFVKVLGELSKEKLKQLEQGLSLDGNLLKETKLRSIQIEKSSFYIILTEGKKRQIRRMCELLDLQVIFLKRVRIGNIQLAGLKEGYWRFLNDTENF